ncbi:alpha/beta hydrolase [Xylophilus sp. GOD-11R]|uniref:alpha/beta fold hydrolase n=1 Tax=Xylophilus sp. GOD-11R TaxID=3089814 RepID=UPI00298C43D8|nr:alpha/beta hydrolase [Xylophilus sp. GOD-11R]WPB55683.1 alpha/beta hydrolase [Xylophilus sp. GOD-11R]
MATFILVHGAWRGAWSYSETHAVLKSAGHAVFTPTMSGLGERFHAKRTHITLETHILDICEVIDREKLNDVILCGHCYGGMVITGVEDRMPQRIRSLVYIDAFVPAHWQSVSSILHLHANAQPHSPFTQLVRKTAVATESGLVPPMPAAGCHASAEYRDWIDDRCVPQSVATFEMPIILSGRSQLRPKAYFLAENWPDNPFKIFAEKFERQSDWKVKRFPCGHDIMVEMPHQLAHELCQFAEAGPLTSNDLADPPG